MSFYPFLCPRVFICPLPSPLGSKLHLQVVEERGVDPGDLGDSQDELSLGDSEEEGEEDSEEEEEEESETELAAAVVHLLQGQE